MRGGAALCDSTNGNTGVTNPPFLARCAINQDAKSWIARWAADLVEDGDEVPRFADLEGPCSSLSTH